MITEKDVNHKSNILYYLLSGIVLYAVVVALYPFLQYYIDPDATSYLTISRKYLEGDTNGAINAFWSPLGIWLTVLWVKLTGLPIHYSAIIVNSFAAIGTLWTSQYLFAKFRNNKFENWIFAIMFGVFWGVSIYRQLFTDIWQYFFLLLALCIFLRKDFTEKIWLWIIAGVIGVMAYFAKAYSFYFFPLMLFSVLFIKWFYYKEIKLTKAVGILLVSVGLMWSLAIPWVYVMYQKYNFITFSTAGKLNLSWWLIGKPIYPEDIKILLPPNGAGSVFYFEDPINSQGAFPRFWHSPTLFLKQILRVSFNYLNWASTASILSAFYFVVWLITIFTFFFKKISLPNTQLTIVAAFFLLYPLPFWLMTFDNGRYLWVTLPLCCILGLYYADKVLLPHLPKLGKQIFVTIFFLSFIISCAFDLKDIANKGKEEYKVAQQLHQLGIKGSFVSNKIFMGEYGHFILRTAYYSQNPWYSHGEDKWTNKEILKDAQRYNIDYYFYFHEGATDDYILKDINGNDLPELTNGTIKGLRVFSIKNR